MDIVIQQYFQNDKIPLEKKQNLANFLDLGEITEEEAVKMIQAKYPMLNFGMPEIQRPVTEISVETPATSQQMPTKNMATSVIDVGKSITEPIANWATQPAWSPTEQYDEGLLTGAAKPITESIKKWAEQPTWSPTEQYEEGLIPKSVTQPITDWATQEPWSPTQQYEKGLITREGIEKAGDVVLKQGLKSTVGGMTGQIPLTDQTIENLFQSKEGSTTGGLIDFGEAMWNRTIGGALDTALGWGATSYANAKSLVVALPYLMRGDFQGAEQIRQKVVTDPVEMGGINFNWIQGDNGKIDFEKTMRQAGGESLEGLGAIMNIISMVNPVRAVQFGWNFLAGGTYGAGEAVEEGKGLKGVLLSGLRDGTIQGIAAKLVGLFQKHLAKAKVTKAEKQLIKRGYTRDQAALIARMTPEQQQLWKDYIKVQAKFAAAGGQGDDVFTYASKDLDDFFSKGVDQLDDMVKTQYKTATKSLENYRVSTKPIKDVMDNMIKEMKIGVKGTKVYHLDFAGSKLDGIPKNIQNTFDDIYRQLQQETIKASKLANIKVDLNDAYSFAKGKMYKATIEGKYIAQIKDAIFKHIETTKEIPKNIGKAFIKANADYSSYIDARNAIYQLGVDKVGSKWVFRGDRLLRSLQQVNRKKYGALVDIIEKTGERFGIPVPKNIMDSSYMATVIEGLSGKSPVLGFRAQIQSGATEAGKQLSQALRSKYGIFRTIIDKGYDAFSGNLPPLTTENLAALDSLAQQAWQQSSNKGIVQISGEAFWWLLKNMMNLERITQYGIPKDIEGVAKTAGNVAQTAAGVVKWILTPDGNFVSRNEGSKEKQYESGVPLRTSVESPYEEGIPLEQLNP